MRRARPRESRPSKPLALPFSATSPGDAPLPPEARLLDAIEIAEAAGVSVRTVRAWFSSSRLPAVHLGRCTRVRLTDWIAFVKAERPS